MKTKKVVLFGIGIALSLILSYVDFLIPLYSLAPGIKMGLANIVVVFALFKWGIKEGIIMSVIKVVLTTIIFGNGMSFIYSIAGALVSILLMILLKRINVLSLVTVSVIGAVSHNLAQIAVAIIVTDYLEILVYLPFLIFAAVISGLIVGFASAVVVKRVN